MRITLHGALLTHEKIIKSQGKLVERGKSIITNLINHKIGKVEDQVLSQVLFGAHFCAHSGTTLTKGGARGVVTTIGNFIDVGMGSGVDLLEKVWWEWGRKDRCGTLSYEGN
jgi:hypothetical protein